MIVILMLVTLPVKPAYAAAWTIAVNITTDENTANTNCSLREAIITANTNADYRGCIRSGGTIGDNADIITLVSGATYVLSIPGANENASNTGDLDIYDSALLTINTSGTGNATIDANALDRVLHMGLNASLTINNIVITGGSATIGAGMLVQSTRIVQVSGSIFDNNQSTVGSGGAIYNYGSTLTIDNTNFTSNSSTDSGGAILLASGTTTITGGTVSGNTALNGGGAISISADNTSINSVVFQNNIAYGIGGGAIYNNSTADNTIIRLSTFNANSTIRSNASVLGGAIYNNGTNLYVANSTFTGNNATESTAGGTGDARGGAIYQSGGGGPSAYIYNLTFSANTASENGAGAASGGNIFRASGTITIANTIVTGGLANGVANNCSGTITNGGNNIDSGITCGWASNLGSFSNTNPSLGTLEGSPAYFPLITGSPALDAGSNTICANAYVNNQSQNGATRPVDGDGDLTATCDIGSFEKANVPPTAANRTVTTNEDTNYTFVSTDFGYNDVDGDPLAGIQVTSIETVGDLEYAGVDVTTGVLYPDVTQLVFKPDPDSNGIPYATFGFQVYDGKDYSIASYTMTINVVSINDAPAGADNTITINEDANYAFVSGDFGFTDPDIGDTLNAVRIDSLPGAGSLELSAVPVAAGDIIPVANIGNLVFTSAGNANGTPYTSFTFNVQDTGGPTFDPSPNTITFNVTAANDAPVAVGDIYATNMDTSLTVTAPGVLANDSDPDGDSLTAVKDTDPANGTVTLNADGSFTYIPNLLFVGTDSFTYHATDGILNSNIVTVNIGVGAVGTQECGSGIFVDKGWEFIFPDGSLPGCVYIFANDATMDEPSNSGQTSLDHRIKVTVYQSGRLITNLTVPYEVCYTPTSSDLKKMGGNYALFRIGIFSNSGNGWEFLQVTNKKGKACASLNHFSYFDLFQVALPATGFAPDVVTPLPKQTVEYTTMGDLWMEIPRLGVQEQIVGVPMTELGWDVTWLGDQIGYLYGTAYPTWAGNSVLTAHVYDSFGKPGPFVGLKGLWWGDKVIVHAFGQEYTYEVRQVQKTGWDVTASVLKHEKLPWLTLVTCKDYDEATNSYRSRVVVRAVLVSVTAEE
ncbi:MAG: Ig-like domain-containing protein [Methanoregulaceae archaeon]|nr:Ig-like domain-containing protein [Methanoregulaceae archaeon]